MASRNTGILKLILLAILVLARTSEITPENCPATYCRRLYAKCSELGSLKAKLAWAYHPQNGTVDIAFRATLAASQRRIGWGINPTSSGMIGTQALIAFRNSSGRPYAYTYDLESKTSLPSPGKISIFDSNLTDLYDSASGDLVILASFTLPGNKTTTTANHAWNVGSGVSGDRPLPHAFTNANLVSFRTIDLA